MTGFIQNVYCGFWVFGNPAFSKPILEKISVTETLIDQLSKKILVLPRNEQKIFDSLNSQRRDLIGIKRDLGDLVGAARTITALGNTALFGASLVIPVLFEAQIGTALVFTGFAFNSFVIGPLYLTYEFDVKCFDYKAKIQNIDTRLDDLIKNVTKLYNNSVFG